MLPLHYPRLYLAYIHNRTSTYFSQPNPSSVECYILRIENFFMDAYVYVSCVWDPTVAAYYLSRYLAKKKLSSTEGNISGWNVDVRQRDRTERFLVLLGVGFVLEL